MMYVCSVVAELRGGAFPQSSSTSVGTVTTWPAFNASRVMICRCLVAVGVTDVPLRYMDSGPSKRKTIFFRARCSSWLPNCVPRLLIDSAYIIGRLADSGQCVAHQSGNEIIMCSHHLPLVSNSWRFVRSSCD